MCLAALFLPNDTIHTTCIANFHLKKVASSQKISFSKIQHSLAEIKVRLLFALQRLETWRCKSMRKWKREIKRKKKEGGRQRKRDFKVLLCGKIIIPSGGGATGRQPLCTKMVSAASLHHQETRQINSHTDTLFLTISFPLSPFLWKVTTLTRVQRAETPCLCIFSHSSSDDVTSPPWRLRVKPNFLYIKVPPLWGALVGQTSAPLRWFNQRWCFNKANALYGFGRVLSAKSFVSPPASQVLPVSYFNQETEHCAELQTGQTGRWIPCDSLNPIQQINASWCGQPTCTFP